MYQSLGGEAASGWSDWRAWFTHDPCATPTPKGCDGCNNCGARAWTQNHFSPTSRRRAIIPSSSLNHRFITASLAGDCASVGCDGDGRVTSLAFDLVPMSGTLPSELGQLEQLRRDLGMISA